MKFLTVVTPELGISLLKMKFLILVTSDLGISLLKITSLTFGDEISLPARGSSLFNIKFPTFITPDFGISFLKMKFLLGPGFTYMDPSPAEGESQGGHPTQWGSLGRLWSGGCGWEWSIVPRVP